ncbi:hypothetical protein [Leptolyngbya sp. FACHB-711]|uniref:hypothetical protein n=1 Tax=Leptolyngbya sp. FACHB-711 TaxID=2692813 RepID=UPI0018F002EF|nr:hypothetical protein [Leptolyngbya sp. FACHB-711]
MMDSWSDYYQRRTIQVQPNLLQEQLLYSHLLDCARVESPDALIERFWMLFIDGAGYPNHEIWLALKCVIDSPYVEKDFKFILNRSCHILINHWLMQPRLHSAISELVNQFDRVPNSHARSRTALRLRQLVKQFKSTEQYAALQRLAQVVSQTPDNYTGSRPLRTLIRRYPCLYEANLLTRDSSDEQRRRVRQIRRQVQRQFERDLACYATHRQIGNSFSLQSNEVQPDVRQDGRLPQPNGSCASLQNPTLLSDRQIDRALLHFGGKIDGSNTYRDRAHRFVTYTSHTSSYRSFKDDLYEYLVESIDPKYGNCQFNSRLHQFLKETLPEHHADPFSDVLMVQTCRRLLNLLVVDSPQKLNHSLFVDLTGNLGITTTIGLLLKIVLICRKVKPCLEARLAILFKHYETYASDAVTWLIQSLENLNIALSLNFGTLKLYQGSSPCGS